MNSVDKVIDGLWVGNSMGGKKAAKGRFEFDLIVCLLECGLAEQMATPNVLHVPIRTDTTKGASIVSTVRLTLLAEIIHLARNAGQRVLVHCLAGMERSPLAIAWYLYTKLGMTLDGAYELLKQKRPIVTDCRSWLDKVPE